MRFCDIIGFSLNKKFDFLLPLYHLLDCCIQLLHRLYMFFISCVFPAFRNFYETGRCLPFFLREIFIKNLTSIYNFINALLEISSSYRVAIDLFASIPPVLRIDSIKFIQVDCIGVHKTTTYYQNF